MRMPQVAGLARVLLHDPPSDYAQAVAASVVLELACSSDQEWSAAAGGGQGLVEGLVRAACGHGARLLAGAALCHMINQDLIQPPAMLKLVVREEVRNTNDPTLSGPREGPLVISC
eukprot:1195069-Prorocentrum_minimum.AAC.4